MKKLFQFFWDKSFLSFAIIGVINTLISLVGCQLLLNALGYWGSSALMYLLTSIFSFFMNRRFSFQSKAPLAKSALRFAANIAVCYIIGMGLAQYLTAWAAAALMPGLTTEWVQRIALLVGQVLFNICNYVGQRLWAFKE